MYSIKIRKKSMRNIFNILVYIFAFIGLSLTAMYFAIRLGITNQNGIIDNQQATFIDSGKSVYGSEFGWMTGQEWQILSTAIRKDAKDIRAAANTSEIDARLIVSIIVPEQLRLFYDNRELFEKIFAPLKILGNQSQFSWGIVGIKKETAIAVETNLHDPLSPYYLGQKYAHILDFYTDDHDQERFARITDDKNHYYSYLYSALFLKQMMTLWQKSGYDIHDRPDILATLYNIGFAHSKPNPNPNSGGSILHINGYSYSFGTLAKQFYDSNLLTDLFPIENTSTTDSSK